MRLTWITSGSLRRPVLAGLVLVLAFVLGAASGAFAQAAPAAEKPNLAFTHDAALIIFYIKPDKTADFEDLMNKLKDALAKADTPEAKQQAAGMKLFKNTAANAQVAVYMLVADPVVKDVEYLVPVDPLQGVPQRRASPARQVEGRQGRQPGGAGAVRPRTEVEVPVTPAHAVAMVPGGRTSPPDFLVRPPQNFTLAPT